MIDRKFYKERKNFLCLDGSKIIPFDEVNDDYCDCLDGSDEPGNDADIYFLFNICYAIIFCQPFFYFFLLSLVVFHIYICTVTKYLLPVFFFEKLSLGKNSLE